MKINMATDDNYFTVGMVVSCKTCHGQNVQGEVLAFDYNSKVLVIKSPSPNKPGLHDVRILNLSFVSDITVLREATEQIPTLKNLNLQKLNSRISTSIADKRRQVNYIGVGVTPQAQKLFHAITKTISDVKWDKETIIVMNDVTIKPPYGVDNVEGKQSAIAHVRKIVEKYYRDQQRESSPASSTSSS
ncbi:hypothetical protein LSH36_66g03012 [Paralvinella palmiformis]|uniref:AD domain-containing protein n=1 Tax=Paralvinella palmiformis TaxID=53620 RepID=A0AAD9K3N9_9ANNE|nr:hypothetical protein LSH36_66g03012 [Paralvinella palmiformis]